MKRATLAFVLLAATYGCTHITEPEPYHAPPTMSGIWMAQFYGTIDTADGKFNLNQMGESIIGYMSIGSAGLNVNGNILSGSNKFTLWASETKYRYAINGEANSARTDFVATMDIYYTPPTPDSLIGYINVHATK